MKDELFRTDYLPFSLELEPGRHCYAERYKNETHVGKGRGTFCRRSWIICDPPKDTAVIHLDDDVAEWLIMNCNGEWKLHSPPFPASVKKRERQAFLTDWMKRPTLGFTDVTDATLFKLRWL